MSVEVPINTIRVVSGLLFDQNRVLMGLRKPDKLRPTMWELPGGKIDPGEKPWEALIRECNSITKGIELDGLDRRSAGFLGPAIR